MKIGRRKYEKILDEVMKSIVYSYNSTELDKFTLDVIGSNILYLYGVYRLGYDREKALEFSIKQFNKMVNDERIIKK